MKKQLKAMPKLSGEDAERDFWAAADSTDFVDWSKASRACFPDLKPSLKTISLRMPEPMLSESRPWPTSGTCRINRSSRSSCGADRRKDSPGGTRGFTKIGEILDHFAMAMKSECRAPADHRRPSPAVRFRVEGVDSRLSASERLLGRFGSSSKRQSRSLLESLKKIMRSFSVRRTSSFACTR